MPISTYDLNPALVHVSRSSARELLQFLHPANSHPHDSVTLHQVYQPVRRPPPTLIDIYTLLPSSSTPLRAIPPRIAPWTLPTHNPDIFAPPTPKPTHQIPAYRLDKSASALKSGFFYNVHIARSPSAHNPYKSADKVGPKPHILLYFLQRISWLVLILLRNGFIIKHNNI